jgi:hypothetical protein
MLIKKIYNYFNNLKIIRRFIKLNVSSFSKFSNYSDDVILLEVNDIYPSIISYSIVSNFLSKKYNAKIVGYNVYKKNLFKKFLNKISITNLNKIYASFGVNEFIDIKKKFLIDANKYPINSKKDLVQLKVDGIKIGDLIYDSYLRQKLKSTIDLTSNEFKLFFAESLKKFFFWKNYFDKNNVKAVISSHTVYDLGYPIRIAIYKNIPAFITGISFLSYFDKKRIFEVNSMAYREYFENLSSENKKIAIKVAKKEIEKKFNSQKGYESSTELYQSSTPSVIENDKYKTFGNIKTKNILKKNNKPNILITAHCFYDSPHAVDNLLFDDFYEWIDHLGKLTNETDYNWYLKKHPHTANKGLNNLTLEKFNKKYPKLEILEENINNSELIKEGIDLALTVYGSVGYEFPYFDIPVLLASKNTSYEGYNFCFQPKTIEEYDLFIKDFKKEKFLVNKNEIYEFYFNRYLASWSLLENYVEHKIKLKHDFFGPKILDAWINQFSKKKINTIENEIDDFVNKKKYRLISKNAFQEINFSRGNS